MIFRINRCIVDTTAFELRRDGEVVAVQPQVFDLLVLLLENRRSRRHQGRDLRAHLEEPHRLGRRALQPHQGNPPGTGRRRHRAGPYPHRPPPRLPHRRPRRRGRGEGRRSRASAPDDGAAACRPGVRRPRGRAGAAASCAEESLRRQPPGRVRQRRARHRQEHAGQDLPRLGGRAGACRRRPCPVHRALWRQRALSADLRGHAAAGRRDRRRQAREST